MIIIIIIIIKIIINNSSNNKFYLQLLRNEKMIEANEIKVLR